MTKEEKRKTLERMLAKCPDILSPKQVQNWTHIGKNKIYEMLKNGELKAFIFRGTYLIAKSDLIEYMVAHSDDKATRTYQIKGGASR